MFNDDKLDAMLDEGFGDFSAFMLTDEEFAQKKAERKKEVIEKSERLKELLEKAEQPAGLTAKELADYIRLSRDNIVLAAASGKTPYTIDELVDIDMDDFHGERKSTSPTDELKKMEAIVKKMEKGMSIDAAEKAVEAEMHH